MTAFPFTPAASATGSDLHGLVRTTAARAAAAVRTALSRARARHDYRLMLLDCEDRVFTDVGLTRSDVLKTYRELGGTRI